MGFFWVNFWFRDFLGLCWKPYGFFWVLIFTPIRSSLSIDIRSTPLGGRVHSYVVHYMYVRTVNFFYDMNISDKQ